MLALRVSADIVADVRRTVRPTTMATLHFIYGFPAAGKTRLGRQLAETRPALMFCEDEWLAALGGTITTLAEYVDASRRVRGLMAPLATRALELGTSVVFDFAGNTVAHRAWVRAIFEAARADHVLHVLDVPLEECRRRLHERNATKPSGLYFGDVSDDLFDAVVPHIVAPTLEEGFTIARH
jgi:predicted kinase